MPIYEYRCQKCEKIIEHMQVTPDGGPDSITCPECKVTALKIPSMVNVAELASGFKEHPIMMTEQSTGELKELDKDHTIMGKPREEESKEVQRLLDIEKLKTENIDKYNYEKGRFHGELLDSDQDAGEIEKQELDTYHEKPGEAADEARRESPLDYPIDDKHYVKVGEQETKNKKGRVVKRKPVLVDKDLLSKK